LVQQKLASLRLEADEASAKAEELAAKVKTLEQENLSKEQETAIKDFKKAADEGQQHGTQNETLQRRLQLLEEEAEAADKTLREANDK
jgi:tropomyosin